LTRKAGGPFVKDILIARMSYAVFFPYNCPTVFIFLQPDKL
jgi:hypothetical protein